MKIIIANFKAEFNKKTQLDWLYNFKKAYTQSVASTLIQEDKKIVLCPSFLHMSSCQEFLKNADNIFFGAQTVSTQLAPQSSGEITASMLNDYVSYVIIAHQAVRSLYNPTQAQIKQMLVNAKKFNLQTVLCIRNENDILAENVDYIAYEPESAIGTGIHLQKEEIENIYKQVEKNSLAKFIYGGSVDINFAKELSTSKFISGFLVGKSSLLPQTFLDIAKNC